jgi:hypothetical protein
MFAGAGSGTDRVASLREIPAGYCLHQGHKSTADLDRREMLL